MLSIIQTNFWIIVKINDTEKKHLFYELKIFKFLPLIINIRSFPLVSRKSSLNESYKQWIKTLSKYPVRSKTLLTSIKEVSSKRLNHPYS